ncbi:hypothetical protein F0562_010714 [Nyssa sinensis]|uniref:Uncharacterized protein n=1 Tax=Nyssa sinensis TaxID=561372 RepID=A0A5J5A4E7_9ASTE|nr:hypothetical protein F0562_010714 [Nyssa sinensis]
MTSPPYSQGQDEDLQSENPNLKPDDEQQQQQSLSQSQTSQIETLETSNPQSPELSGLDQPQDQPEQEQQLEGLQTLVQEDQFHQNQEPDDHSEQSGMALSPSIPDTHVAVSDLNPPPLISSTNPPRRPNKRKKCSIKKQQAIEKKLQTLSENLKPVPFIPSKTLDFPKHEKLLKCLGLWDFVHIEFDRNIRIDLVAQLIATYDQKMRCSYVNEFRIAVNRADLARAFKLPVKKDKGNVSSSEAVDLDSETFSEESISFIEDLVSNWVLLHEDTWMMPSEVLNWTRAIKDGHPEKVDWASLIWFMVEKELLQGQQLEDCYYASHLQCLIKSQREEVFCEEPKLEGEVEVKEEEDGGNAKMGASDDFHGQNNTELEEYNIELTLGQDIAEKEEVKDEDMMDLEECKEEGQGQWFLEGKNNAGEQFLQRCNFEEGRGLNSHEEGKEEDEEEEEEEEEEVEEEEEQGDGFSLMPNGETLEGDGLTGNLLQGLETTHVSFGSAGELRDQSAVELLASRAETHAISGGPSIFGNGGKREIGQEHDISHHSLNGSISNKRLRTDGLWDHKSSDFGICMEQVQHLMGKARMMYEAKEQAYEDSNMNQQLLLNEMQRRDSVIEHLHKTRIEELQKRDGEIFRLERELFLMGNLLEGYRKALKETHKTFSEYRQRCQLPEEPLYKDAGPGGVVLSTMELEKQRLKREEEDRLNRIMIKDKIKDIEEENIGKLEAHLNTVHMLDKKLTEFENEVKLLMELSAKRKVPEMSECAPNE